MSTPESEHGPSRPPARHVAHWPPALPQHLTLPATNLFHNAEVSAARFPDKPFIVFYDTVITFREFHDECERIAGYLQHQCFVAAGDRVLLYMQNSPQWILAFYGILRANAVVVPVNPMNRTEELRHYVHDTGATTAFVAQDLCEQMQPLLADRMGSEAGGEKGLRHLIVATYSDYLKNPTDLKVPNFVVERIRRFDDPAITAWRDMLASRLAPGPLTQGADDLAVMPYTSGTTGQPKGCMHTHRSVMSTLVGGVHWFQRTQDSVFLTVLPLFHVTGLSGSMNGPLYAGGTIVVLPRWDRDTAALCMQRYRVDTFQAITTMLVDFLSNPRLAEYDLSSLRVVRGGGAAMPAAVAAKLFELTGQHYIEGYGMSETMAATHINPMHRPKPQCLGIPVFDVDARVIDPATLHEVPQGESGEIVVAGPQVMRGYWNDAPATERAFVEIDGRRFLRTGDLARVDADGYFFMVDRLKRMINASGYKVWPREVEDVLAEHPSVRESAVIGVPDEKRGETVKAFVSLKPGATATPEELIAHCKERMAAYKYPRQVVLIDELPKTVTGKILRRELRS